MAISSKKAIIDFIITCSCSDTPKFAQEAFSIIFPDFEIPETILRNKLPSFIPRYEGTIFGNYLNALYKNKEKFAYYFQISEDGDIVV